MVINQGEKVHFIRRRNFVDDLRRHFLGEVKEVDGQVVRVEGYVFIFDPSKCEYLKKVQKRTTIVNLGDSGYIVNIIPIDVNIEQLVYKRIKEKLVVTDDKSFSLDINEFGINR